jgi:hypothetical protein
MDLGKKKTILMTFLTINAKFNIFGSYNLSVLISSSMKHIYWYEHKTKKFKEKERVKNKGKEIWFLPNAKR